jgi:adenylate cyclase
MLLGVIVSVVVTALSRVGLFAGWETRAVDAFLFFRDRVPSPAIVLVTIDEDAFRELGGRQPLDRRYLADLGDFLLRSGARVVGFDIQLAQPSTPDEDTTFIAMTRRWEEGRLVFTSLAVPRKGEAPERYDSTQAFSPDLSALPGFANAPIGADGIVRRLAPVLPAADGGFLPSFALTVLAGATGYPAERLSSVLKAGADAAIAVPLADRAGQLKGTEPIALRTLAEAAWRIDFTGPPGTFPAFPSGALVQMARSGIRPEADNPFNGKIVLVGATFAESRDFFQTPVGLMAGVEIQANIVHTLLARRALLPPSFLLNLSVLTGACLAAALLSLWLRPLWVALISVAMIAGFVLLSYEAYTSGGYWLDFVGPLVAMLAYLQSSTVLARRRLRSAFGQYVSPEVMDRVLREGAALGGEVRAVSVLMSDLRGFTTLSEQIPPARITEIMNEYLTAMVDVIVAHHGMVSDFIGDGILAIFGAPLDDPEHAWHAVETTLGMQAALARLNERWRAAGQAPLAMGIAVNTGEVFAGNVGSPRKKKYTVMGDPVNTVSRMEGLNRELGTAILISGTTLAAVKGRVQVRERGEFKVKGKAQPVAIFELLGTAGDPPDSRATAAV